MKRHLIGLVGMSVVWAAVATAAPSGQYAVTGTYPGGESYDGTAAVAVVGQTVRVEWGDASGPVFVGAGFIIDGLLIVAYDGTQDHRVSVAAYRIVSDDRLEGIWTVVGENGGQVAKETWTRAKQAAPVRLVPLPVLKRVMFKGH